MIADLEACEIIAMPLAADRALTIAERYAFFRAHVTEADRAEFAAWKREEAERKEVRASIMEYLRYILERNALFVQAVRDNGHPDWKGDPPEYIAMFGAETFRRAVDKAPVIPALDGIVDMNDPEEREFAENWLALAEFSK